MNNRILADRNNFQETGQVGYCGWRNAVKKIEMDSDGQRYCARCGRVKNGRNC